MTDRELMQQALETLIASGLSAHATKKAREAAVTALRERLALPEQEPFGYFQYSIHLDAWVQNKEESKGIAFYTAPPQRKPLTENEIADEWEHVTGHNISHPMPRQEGRAMYISPDEVTEFARAVIAKAT